MNYVVPSRTLRNLKSIGMRAYSFYNLVRSQPFECQRLIIPSLNLKVSSINQNPIINVELPSFFYVKGASFIVNTLENIVDVVVHSSHSVELVFYSGRGEFVVVIEMYSAWLKAIETSA